jgi:hypothetical protein
LRISTVDGSLYRVELLGVERLRADNFREGNIVLDMTVRSGQSVNERDLLTVLSIEDASKHQDFVDSFVKRVRSGSLSLVEINPSYGCALACLCTSLEIHRVTGDGQDG